MFRKDLRKVEVPRAVCCWPVCAVFTIAAMAGGASGQASPKRYPISDRAIISAMQERRVPVSGLQIRIAAPITASVAHPELDIRSFTMGNKHSAQLLMSCRNSAECLPFYVSASWPVEMDAANLNGSLVPGANPTREAANRTFSGDLYSFRAGSIATLMLDGDRVHVMLRVVCLESGEPGERVRVATPDRRQEYDADVIAPGVLKGTF